MKKGRKINLKFTFLLFVVLSSIGILNMPKTYSRFVDGGQLVYKAGLYNMYSEYPMTLVEATLEKAKFEFDFLPNKAITDKKDRYEIIIPKECTFDDIISSGVKATINNTTRTVTFDTRPSDATRVLITCAIDSNKDQVEFTAKNNEIIVDENRKLAYMKYSFKESYQDYLKRIAIGIENPKVIPYSENIYDIFIKWITAYARSINRETEILDYVRNTYPNKAALINPDNFNALLGFKIEHNAATNEYTFTILDNFVGYARTYYGRPGGIAINLYFSTTDRDILNEAFKNYLNLYVYPGNSTTANNVYQYVIDKQGIYSIIFYGNKNIKGLELISHNTKTLDTQIKLTKDTISSGANDYIKSPPQVDFEAYKGMLVTFQTRLQNNYNNIALDTKKAIYLREEIKASITKNCTRDKDGNNVTTPPVAFTDYFIHQDGSRYLLIKIASDGKTYNTFEIDELSIPNGMNISFDNVSDTNLKVSIHYTAKEAVMDIVSYLNTYFKTSVTESNVTVIADTANEYAIEYTIIK